MTIKLITTPCLHLSPKHKPQNDGVLVPRTNWLGITSSNLIRTRSFEYHPKQKSRYSVRRACSAIFDNSIPKDDEFSQKIEELLALEFQPTDPNSTQSASEFSSKYYTNSLSFGWEENEILANCDYQKKNKSTQKTMKIGESANCSVKRAFSSMVFIIRELHSYSLQMLEALYFQDLQGILSRVQCEMHASFVWLFQQVFSRTPTLMVYVMILLTNFTVHSMLNNNNSVAFASSTPPPVIVATVDDTSMLNSFTCSLSVGGNNGGGNNIKPVGTGMDGDRDGLIVSDDVTGFTTREESVSGREEVDAWKRILDEASKMQGKIRGEYLDSESTRWFVSPVAAKIEANDVDHEYLRTELKYQRELAEEPNDVLLLANYAQFLYLVVHDYDRAEIYFKRAIGVEPKDAEALSKYAHFLWQIRNDLWAAEETYLEAISADPSNSFYAASYAHFLWNTGGEDTCFPLDDSPDDETIDT